MAETHTHHVSGESGSESSQTLGGDPDSAHWKHAVSRRNRDEGTLNWADSERRVTSGASLVLGWKRGPLAGSSGAAYAAPYNWL